LIRHSSFVIRHWVKFLLCGLLLIAAQIADASLEKYSTLIAADQYPFAQVEPNSIRVTYLGVNGFQFETDDYALLVDPYFTRVGLWASALNERIESNPTRVNQGLRHVRNNVDAILVTHAHFDHLLDAPEIMRRTHARLVAGPTAIKLVESFGISPDECDVVKSGGVRQIGPWTIRVFAAQHDRLFGKIPFAGRSTPSKPVKASDWVVGEPLAFEIEAAGKRIYIDSGGVPGAPLDPRIKDVDLAILGVALPDSRARFGEAIRELRPRYIFPSHQDNMFAPFDRGFAFGKMTNFPAIAREHKKDNLPGRLILLDYFRPWTLH
jgi:L-ascorbate metabolism protein UlaG (beta-lactamase superfamily)